MRELTEAQKERLYKLSEECAEVIQVVSKILLWGYESSSPVLHSLGNETNRELLENEIAHVRLWANKLDLENDIDSLRIHDAYVKKLHYLQQNPEMLKYNEFY